MSAVVRELVTVVTDCCHVSCTGSPQDDALIGGRVVFQCEGKTEREKQSKVMEKHICQIVIHECF